MSGTTANYLWPYPSGTDTPAGHTQMQALATAIDTSLKTVQNTALSKPAAGIPYAAGTLTALTSISVGANNPLAGVTVAGGISVATPTLTVPVAGRYLVTAVMNFSAVASRAWFYLADAGSVNLTNSSTVTTAGSAANLAAVVTLAAGGQIKFMTNAASWPISTTTGAGLGVFTVVYLGG